MTSRRQLLLTGLGIHCSPILHIAPHVTGPVKETLVVSAAGRHDPRQSKSEGGKLQRLLRQLLRDDLVAVWSRLCLQRLRPEC